MSKLIKQMEMAALKKTFDGVRDAVVLNVQGLSSDGDYGLRTALRKKNIRLHVVKNTLCRKVFGELGLQVPDDSPYWAGPTTVAYGGTSLGELSRELDAELSNPKKAAQYKDKVVVKGAIGDGQVVAFDLAKKMPTRQEAIAAVLQAILSGGSNIAGALTGPAAQVASQVQKVSEKTDEGAAAAPPAA